MTNDELAKGRAELARLERLGGDPMRRRDGRGQLDLDGALPDLTAALDALADVDKALAEVTKCQAPTPGQRIRDAFEHIHLVTDAVIFDAEKAEQSTRAQCVYWMGAAAAVAKERDEAQADRERLQAEIAEWYNEGCALANTIRDEHGAQHPAIQRWWAFAPAAARGKGE